MKSELYVTGISLTNRERKIVEDLEKSKGVNNFSAALRIIINEWQQMKSEYVRIPIEGVIIENGVIKTKTTM